MIRNVPSNIYMIKKILFFILITLSLSTHAVSKPEKKSSEVVEITKIKDVEEFLIRKNTEMMEQYILHHNTEPYADLMLDDYLLVVEIGLIEDRELILTTVGNLDIQSAKLTNEEFLHYDSTAVLIGTLEMEGKILGHTIDGKLRYMSVFILHEGRWRLLSGSFSPVVHPSILYGLPEKP
jgi:hypothetical protein